MHRRMLLLVGLLLALPVHAANWQDFQPCEPLDPHFKSSDINDPATAGLLQTVESNHFTPQVERLEKGATAPLPRDIAFVLRYIPNHYRALNAMARWQLNNKLPTDPEALVWTADCYFQRAIAFVPSDSQVHFVYAVYLHKAKRLAEAQKQYVEAEDLSEPTAELYYNRGLLEVDLGDLDAAQKYADRAYELGYPLRGLRDKLARARAKQANPH
jgi:tetratricopeptide (TPR) repeat protein